MDDVALLVYDGDCGFCTASARFLAGWVSRGRYRVEPWQALDLPALGLDEERCRAAVQFVDADGRVSTGHLAVARALRLGAPAWRPLGSLLAARPVAPIAARCYTWVADHRYALPGATAACGAPRPPGHH